MTMAENIEKYGKRSEFHIHLAPHHSNRAYSIVFFFGFELACVLTKLEELAQSQTVILVDLARVMAVLLLIRTFLPEDDAAQLFRPQILDEKKRILQQSWILICILNNFYKDTIFVHYFHLHVSF